ncbi:hypothetical protein ACFQU7_10830 [Pseudoroseomonas wenyumeiae]
MERRINRLTAVMLDANSAGDKERENRFYNAATRFVPGQHQLLDELMSLRATTPGGLRAKAEVLATRVMYETRESPMGEYLPIWSICRDLLGYEPTEGVE